MTRRRFFTEGQELATRFIRQEMVHQGRLFPLVHAAFQEYLAAAPTAASLRELQRTRLAAVLRRAATQVPFYHRDHGWAGPGDDDPFEALGALPLVDRETVRTRLVDLCSDDIDPARCRFGSTSGTSGVPLRVVFDEPHLVHLYALAQVRDRRHGLDFHQKVLVPFQNWMSGWFEYTAPAQGLARIAEFGVATAAVPGISVDEALARAVGFDPDVVFGHPGNCVRLAHLVAARGLPIRPVVVLTYGERLLPGTRSTLRAAFGAPVRDQYGMREVGTIAAECAEGSYHLECERLWVEVVDPATGAPVPDGAEGELVVTNLLAEAMPLLRYRTGDLGALGTGPCGCGRPQRVLRLVEGRELPGVPLPGGEVVPTALLVRVLRRHPVERFQLVHEAPDRLLVLVRPAPHAELDLDDIHDRLAAETRGLLAIAVRPVDDDGFRQGDRRKHADLIGLPGASRESAAR
ncbi:MAG TPA: AMP-binding protein [Pseudonocardiaceae bacterium]